MTSTPEDSGQYVAFGFNAIKHKVVRIGGHETLWQAARQARAGEFTHKGVAKVRHPQSVWFLRGARLIKIDKELTLDIITLLGV